MPKFKIPSLDTLIGSTLGAVKRFPMVMLCALMAAVMLAFITNNGWDYYAHSLNYTFTKIIMCCELGLPLFFGMALLSETGRHGTLQKILWEAVILALMIVYFFTLGNLQHINMVRTARYILFVSAAHLFVSFAPFFKAGNLNGFWQYNKTLFLRFLLATLYTCVLYGGISLALWSVDELLHISISYKAYLDTWYILACVFNTCFFVAGIPANIKELENDTSYLKGLKVFTQYVLLPLVTVYLLILYVYIGKILVAWSLPRGLVSYLVIYYSVAGIFSLLLIYPVRNNEGNRWIHIFSRWFYAALFPLIIMLGISIFSRITQYGITENRYFILVLALWLLGTAVYFVSGTKSNIKIIPISLCLILIASSFGPWGAFSISEHSQMRQLKNILAKNNILINGKVDKKNVHHISTAESVRVESILDYLDNSGALNMLQPWFAIKIDTIKYDKTNTLLTEMNISSDNSKYDKTVYFNRQIPEGNTYCINVKGFDYYATFNYSAYNSRNDNDTSNQTDSAALGYFMLNTDTLFLCPPDRTGLYRLKKNKTIVALFNLNGFLQKLDKTYDTTNVEYRQYNVPTDKFRLDVFTADSTQVRFMFKSITVDKSRLQNKLRLEGLDADVLVKQR